jgi:hypothetical protein
VLTFRIPRFLKFSLGVVALVAAAVVAHSASAAVVVLANHGEESLAVEVLLDGKPPRRIEIPPGDARPVEARRSASVRVPGESAANEHPLQPYCLYAVEAGQQGAATIVRRVDFGGPAPNGWPAVPEDDLELPGGRIVPVKILVDEDERRPREAWEPDLRSRIDAASRILKSHAGIEFRVVAVDAWNSDDAETDFFRSLGEFEREVNPAPARLAIGFSSQYQIAVGRTHMGGTRGPLHPHVLLKERAGRILDAERREHLVHELGHFLGATHSAEPQSVMRPVIANGSQRALGAQIKFDGPNTLLMAMLGEEMRHGARKIDDVSPIARHRMLPIYASLNPALPDDPAAEHFLGLVASAGTRELVDDARKIYGQIIRVAKLRDKLPPTDVAGDRLVELYVRQAAIASQSVRRGNSPRALLLALGAAMDDCGALARLPATKSLTNYLEGESLRQERLALEPLPTMHGSASLARHFFSAGLLVAVSGVETARSDSTVRELCRVGEELDPAAGVPFDHAAANTAGTVFAAALMSGRITVQDVAERYSVAAVLPQDALRPPPGQQPTEQTLRGLEGRLMALPFYQTTADEAP